MRIIRNELKKIFNIKSLLVLLVITFIIYYMFIRFNIEVFPNGRPTGDIYDIAKEFIEEEGINTSEVGIDYFLNLKEKYKEEANNYLLNNPVAKEIGITTYEEFQESGDIKGESYDNENNIKANELHDNIMFEEQVDVFWKLQAVNSMIIKYDNFNRIDTHISEQQNERINEIINSKSYRDVLPSEVLENYNGFIFNSTALVLISIIFLLAPIFTKDKHRNLEQIQYTTKRGRKLYKDKIITSLISSLIIVTMELGVLFFLYLTRENIVEMFYNSSINSWLGRGFYWFDLTFKEYIFITISLIYIFALCLSLFIAFISRKCSRYITLIGFSLLLTIGFFKLVTMEGLVFGGLGWIYKPKFLVLGFLIIMAILGSLLIIIQSKNEKKRSVLS
ncbi:hypothetical protein [Clostridium sp.]|uniref:hypothetical protein n=1 Tax=Clostridium sp. TaxID=1506 RepID=UPI0025C2F336|nr:hypothetical protein [Clostridium sp.]